MISRAADEPVEPGHLDVEDGEVGLELADQLDGLVAPAGLAHDLVALLLEGLLEVEADDGLVFGDHCHNPESSALEARTIQPPHRADSEPLQRRLSFSASSSSSWRASSRSMVSTTSARRRNMASA